MDLKTFLAAVRMYWKRFVSVTVTVLALGVTWLVLTPTKYVSTMQLLVTIQGSTTAAAYQNEDVVSGRINSYIALLTSDVVSQRVIDKLGLPLTAPELAAKISATNVPPKTSIIDVAVTDESPEQARRLADTLGGEFVSYTDALETPTGEDGQKMHTTVVTAAGQPHSRLAERVLLGVLLAFAALLVGAIAVWTRSLTDRVVRTANRATAAAGVPVLGRVTSAAPNSVGDFEGYRRLRTRLRSTTGADGGRVLEITSVDGGGDATKVAYNLGHVLGLAGSRSVIVDADLSRYDADGNNEHWGDRARAVDGFPDTLSVRAWAAEPERVATKSAFDLVKRLRGDYENVLIATPPVLSTVTASVVSEHADAVLLLISVGRTKRRDVVRAAESLKATEAPLIGTVLVGEHGGGGSAERSRRKALSSQRSKQSRNVTTITSNSTNPKKFGSVTPSGRKRWRGLI
jgi:capsular polysaccharide biosynthesis protein